MARIIKAAPVLRQPLKSMLELGHGRALAKVCYFFLLDRKYIPEPDKKQTVKIIPSQGRGTSGFLFLGSSAKTAQDRKLVASVI
jgi:hypothetical protein